MHNEENIFQTKILTAVKILTVIHTRLKSDYQQNP